MEGKPTQREHQQGGSTSLAAMARACEGEVKVPSYDSGQGDIATFLLPMNSLGSRARHQGLHRQMAVGELGSGPGPTWRHHRGRALPGPGRQAVLSPPGRRHLLPNKVLSPVLEQLLTDPGGYGRRGWSQCSSRSPCCPPTGDPVGENQPV